MCLRHHLGFTDLAAGRVRNSAGANFLSHRTGCVRNLLGNRFAGPRAGCVRNLLGNRFAGPRAGRVRNLLGNRFAGPRAGRIRNLLIDRVLFVTNTVIRNLLHAGFRNLAANRVGLLAVTDFLLHAGAGDCSHFRARNPVFAANRSAGLFANRSAAAGLVAATAMAGIPFPRSGVADTLLDNGAGNLLRFRDPVAGAVGHLFGFANGLADGVADVTVAGLGFGPVGCAANVAILGLTNRLAHRAADVAVASIDHGFANGAADVTVAGLEARLANRAADVAVAGLNARLFHRAANIAIAGLIDRLANRVAFVAIVRFVNGPRARNRYLFTALIVDCSAAVDCSLLIDSFANCLIAGPAAAFCGAIVAAGCARGSGTTLVTGRPAI